MAAQLTMIDNSMNSVRMPLIIMPTTANAVPFFVFLSDTKSPISEKIRPIRAVKPQQKIETMEIINPVMARALYVWASGIPAGVYADPEVGCCHEDEGALTGS